jgi:pimeloyl-ACP methyl ester carboxylesterase
VEQPEGVAELIETVVWVVGLALLFALGGALYQILGARRDRSMHPPPGRLVDVGGHRLHVRESGQGSPTILLEAGLMSTVLSWTELQTELAGSFRVVSYDRAGLGWSDLGPMPRTAGQIVTELHDLLEHAAIRPPYVLVGHSFGGLTMPLFAARFSSEVAGMVLVDPVAPMEWNPPSEHDRKLMRIGAKVCRRAAVLARIGVIRFIAMLLTSGLKKPAGYLVRLISRGTPGESGRVSSPWFAALPASEKAMASVFWIEPKFAVTIASQLENLPVSAASVATYEQFCDKKVVILSASTAPEARLKEHAAIAGRLPRGEFVMAEKSNHWIMQQDSDLVIQTIKRVARSVEPAAQKSAAKTMSSRRGD